VDTIRYEIHDSYPVPQRDTAMIFIRVGEGISLNIHNVITPNGDGMNEKWIIEGIEEYPQNTVLIFNRWGDEITTFNGYNNSDVVWDGSNKHGEPVPDGTYFYIVKIQYKDNFQGWIFVRANGN
jgi:gliding motility-associated-like protein